MDQAALTAESEIESTTTERKLIDEEHSAPES
jgi:hypothetical protein